MNEKDIFIPSFQRGFVWTHRQSSRFIESLLLGLPAPGIFLSRDDESKRLLVIDGQQRLRTLQYFYNGVFGEAGPDFRLVGVDPEFEGTTYSQLKPADRRMLDDAILHATVVKQEEPPGDESSIYYIFERINTGGTQLFPQEIRACIYQGKLNDLLAQLNKNRAWRAIFGAAALDQRSKDQELVLRFLALYHGADGYEGPMNMFLNRFMSRNRNPRQEEAEAMAQLFESTVGLVADRFGSDAFRPAGILNAMIYDSVMVGLARRIQEGPIEDARQLLTGFTALLTNAEFLSAIRSVGDDDSSVARRMKLATAAFAGAR